MTGRLETKFYLTHHCSICPFSPAGTTASALYELENGKFRTVIKDAIWACYRRSLEMGGADSNVGPGRVSFPPPPPIISHHPVEAPVGEMAADDDEDKNGMDARK